MPHDRPGYDALLYVSFGGPEEPGDVMPFLRRVTAGRDVPEGRLEEVAEHYHGLGGRSPINDQNRAVIAALRDLLAEEGPHLPVYFGNRNWHPLLADTLAEMADDGVDRALAYVTSAYSSYSGCRQYREDLAAAREQAGVDVRLDKLRVFYNHPGFIAPQTERVRAALAGLPAGLASDAHLLFVTHSIPRTMARHCDYEAQTLTAARLVAERLDADHGWDVVYCSRSGPPHVPWLGPDVGEAIADRAAAGVPAVVVVPIGFVSDHVEVRHDLDVEAAGAAEEAGVAFARAGTVGDHPRFVRMIRELVRERTGAGAPRRALGMRGPGHDVCPSDCCLTPGQTARPTVAGADPVRG